MEIGTLGIPKIKLEHLLLIQTLSMRAVCQYQEILETTDKGHEITKSLTDDPRVIALNGQMVSTGSGDAGFDPMFLSMWYLWCINEYGEEKAKDYLNRFLSSDKIQVLNTLWVLGIKVTKPIVINGDYIIKPVDCMPDSDDKEYYLQHTFGNWQNVKITPQCAITKLCEIKKAGTETSIMSPAFKMDFHKVSKTLHDISLLLNALRGIYCLAYSSTSYVEPTTPLGIFNGSGGGMTIYDVTSHTSTELQIEPKTSINRLFTNFSKLCDAEKDRFRIILSRLSQAKRGTQIEDKILDLGIALEMLLLKDKTEKEQLALTFRLRGSWLIDKDDPENRYKKYNQLKDLYNYRSRVAHSGKLEKDVQKLKTIRNSFTDYQSLAEDICQIILSEGSPDWDKLILDVK